MQSCVERTRNLLIILATFQAVLCCVAAIEPRRSSSLNHPDHKDYNEEDHVPFQYADDSLITPTGKSNKVSKLLRFIHNKAGNVVYQRKGAQQVLKPDSYRANKNFNRLTDDQVIENVCTEQSGSPCKYAVKVVRRAAPQERMIIANAIRHKPEYVDGTKLLYHKLFESAIAKAERNNLDEKIDSSINLFAKKSPYAWAATKALDVAVSKI